MENESAQGAAYTFRKYVSIHDVVISCSYIESLQISDPPCSQLRRFHFRIDCELLAISALCQGTQLKHIK